MNEHEFLEYAKQSLNCYSVRIEIYGGQWALGRTRIIDGKKKEDCVSNGDTFEDLKKCFEWWINMFEQNRRLENESV